MGSAERFPAAGLLNGGTCTHYPGPLAQGWIVGHELSRSPAPRLPQSFDGLVIRPTARV
jgi:hypothetical protein